MMTAILTVRNILADREMFDVWRVNQDAEYHEEGTAGEKTFITSPPDHVERIGP